MLKFKQFFIYKSKYKPPLLLINRTFNFIIILFIFKFSFVNSASLIFKPPNKCGHPGVPLYGKLLNNLAYPSSFSSRSSASNLITNQNDIIVSNNSEISIDILNFNNNGLDQNQIVYEQGEIVSYSCLVGHLMIGSAYRKCLPNGKWSNNLPICDTLLDQFDLMKNVESTNQAYLANQSANITNNIKNQDSLSTLTVQSSNFLKFAPPESTIDYRTCFHSEKYGLRMFRINLNKSMKIIGIAVTIPRENLDYNFSVYISNSKQNMGKGRLCFSFRGTFATKTTILLCQTTILGDRINIEDNFKQIQTFSICEIQIYIEKDKIECGEPEIPLNGFIVSRREDQIEYQCKLGYYLTGSPIRQCRNGVYSGEQAVCNEIQCKEENHNSNMNDHQLSLQISAQLNSLLLNCEPGYQFAGIRNHTIICLGDGRFDTRITPLCESIDCGGPLYLSEQVNGEFIPLEPNKTTYGSIAKLKCFDSNSVYSSEDIFIHCSSNGEWTPPKAICISDPLKSIAQTRQLKNRLGTLIVSIILILVLLILLLTIYLFKKRILLLALDLNDNKLNESNIRRNVNLISNNNMVNNADLVNQVNSDLCLDVDSSSNSENNSSQPSSKISIQKLFRNKSNSTNNNSSSKFFAINLKDKLINLKNSIKTTKFKNYFKCLNKNQLNRSTVDEFTITNQFLNSQLNPIFIDQLDCQETPTKECSVPFKQYSSTLKPNQINLVRLANQQRQQRVAYLLKASNYHFNQFNQHDQIKQFNRNQLINSSMKSDSLLVNTRRQFVRDELIETIRKKSNLNRTSKKHLNETPTSQLLINKNKKKTINGESSIDNRKEGKQFYYFAQHCYTLQQKNQNHQIGHLIEPQKNKFSNNLKSTDDASDILNNCDSIINTTSSNSSNEDSNYENSTNKNCLPIKSNSDSNTITNTISSQFSNENALDRKSISKLNNKKLTTTADIHLKNNHIKNSTSQIDKLIDLENKSTTKKEEETKLNRLNSNIDVNLNSNTKYIVIDDTVFAD